MVEEQLPNVETDKEPVEHNDRWKIWLRRADQSALVLIFGIAISVICVSLLVNWFAGRKQIDIEKAEPKSVDYRVDLNQARWPEIANLPGVGEKLAKQIINHRETHGPFTEFDGLLAVDGIGEKKLAKMRPFLMPFD